MDLSPRYLKKLDKPWLTTLLVIFCFVGFLFAYCVRHHNFSASQFVYAGNKFCDPDQVPKNLIVMANDGYDGEFFYRLTLNPFTHQKTEYGISIDAPPYRQQRIFYPLIAYLCDMGNPLNAPRSLLLLNLAAIAGITYLAGLYAQEKRLHALWGILAGLNAGAFVTLQRDTSEIFSLFLALLGLHLVRRRKYVASMLVLIGAMLTRETTLVVSAAILVQLLAPRLPLLRTIETFFTKQPADNADGRSLVSQSAGKGGALPDTEPGRWDWALFLVPFAVYICWQAFLTHLWGISASTFSGGRVGIPFGGIREMLLNDGGAFGPANLPIVASQLFLIVYAFLATAGELRESTAAFSEKLAWCVYALMGLCYTYTIYLEDYGYMRILLDFFAFSAFILYGASRKVRWQLLLVMLAVDLIQARAFIYHR